MPHAGSPPAFCILLVSLSLAHRADVNQLRMLSSAVGPETGAELAHLLGEEQEGQLGSLAKADTIVAMMDTISRIGGATNNLLRLLTVLNVGEFAVASGASGIGAPFAILGAAVAIWAAYKEKHLAQICGVESILERLGDVIAEVAITKADFAEDWKSIDSCLRQKGSCEALYVSDERLRASLASIADVKGAIISGFCSLDLLDMPVRNNSETALQVSISVTGGYADAYEGFHCKSSSIQHALKAVSNSRREWESAIFSTGRDAQDKVAYTMNALDEVMTLANSLAEPHLDFMNDARKAWHMDVNSERVLKRLVIFNTVLQVMTSGKALVTDLVSATSAISTLMTLVSEGLNVALNLSQAYSAYSDLANLDDMQTIKETFTALQIDITTASGQDILLQQINEVLGTMSGTNRTSRRIRRRIELFWLERIFARLGNTETSPQGRFRRTAIHFATVVPYSKQYAIGYRQAAVALVFKQVSAPQLEPISTIEVRCSDEAHVCDKLETKLGSFRPGHKKLIISSMMTLSFDSEGMPCTADMDLRYPFSHRFLKFANSSQLCEALGTFLFAGFHIDESKSSRSVLKEYRRLFREGRRCDQLA